MQSTPAAPDRIVAIDWSGRQDAAGQRRHIWAATWTSAAVVAGRPSRSPNPKPEPRARPIPPAQQVLGGTVTLESGRTRDEVADWLLALARDTPNMVVGIDMCFSLPAWFVRDELGLSGAPALWQLVAASHGERWLARRDPADPDLDRRFWGKPHKRPPEFSGDNLHRMLRATDIDCKILSHIPEAERAARVRGITPKSPFQIGGSGSVGTGSLRGMPILLRLHQAGFRVWPFDPAPLAPGQHPSPLVVEMYTRLMTGPVHKSNPTARRAYLDRLRRPTLSTSTPAPGRPTKPKPDRSPHAAPNRAPDPSPNPAYDPRYAALPRAVLRSALSSEDAFDALVSCMVMTARRAIFPRLPQPRDPDAHIEGWTWAPDVDTTC